MCSHMHTTIIGSTTQVIVKHSHGHLFVLLDIILGIPIQAQAIPMNACDVKAILRYIESDTSSLIHRSLMQHHKWMTSPATLCRQPPCTCAASTPVSTSTGRQNSEKAISLLNAEFIYVLKQCIKAKHKAIINQLTNRLGPTGISIYSGLACRTLGCAWYHWISCTWYPWLW